MVKSILDGAHQIVFPLRFSTLCIASSSCQIFSSKVWLLLLPRFALCVVFAMMASDFLSRLSRQPWQFSQGVETHHPKACASVRTVFSPDSLEFLIRGSGGCRLVTQPSGKGGPPARIGGRCRSDFRFGKPRRLQIPSVFKAAICFRAGSALQPAAPQRTRIEGTDKDSRQTDRSSPLTPRMKLTWCSDNIGLPVGGVNLVRSRIPPHRGISRRNLVSLKPGHKSPGTREEIGTG